MTSSSGESRGFGNRQLETAGGSQIALAGGLRTRQIFNCDSEPASPSRGPGLAIFRLPPLGCPHPSAVPYTLRSTPIFLLRSSSINPPPSLSSTSLVSVYTVGDFVWVTKHIFETDASRSLDNQRSGPYKIFEVMNNGLTYKGAKAKGPPATKIRHISYLKPVTMRDMTELQGK